VVDRQSHVIDSLVLVLAHDRLAAVGSAGANDGFVGRLRDGDLLLAARPARAPHCADTTAVRVVGGYPGAVFATVTRPDGSR